MNRLAEDMIERELEVLALGLEVNLTQTIELLRAYRGEGRAEAWSEFADAEALPEPLRARRTSVMSPSHVCNTIWTVIAAMQLR